MDSVAPSSYIWILSACFAALFAAYFTVQQFLTTVLGNSGFASLSIIYTFFTLGTLLSPIIVVKLGVLRSMQVAATSYSVFIAVCAMYAGGSSPLLDGLLYFRYDGAEC
jgi:hypothetical protein